MAKAAVAKDNAPPKETKNLNQTKKKKKKKEFWKNHPKIAAKEEKIKKTTPVVPPRTPQEFSSNWKALQALLKPENSSPEPTPTKPPKKQDKGLKKEEKANGKERLEPTAKTAAPKVNGQVKETPTAPKKTATKEPATTDKRKETLTVPKKTATKEPATTDKRKETLTAPKKTATKEPATTDKRKETLTALKKTATKEPATTDKREETTKKRKLPEERDKRHLKKKPSEDITAEPPKIDLWFDDVDPDDIEAALGPEAGNIARQMQGLPEKAADNVDRVLVKDRAFDGLTRTVAMDCEMVGVGTNGEESILARVSIVNQFGKCVYDKFVKPTERVTDYRTAVSGVRPQDVKNGEDFKVVQKEVSEILKGRILVGHAVHNDLKIFFLDHPKKTTRDTQKYKPFKQKVKASRPSLKLLCEKILNVKVQTGEHCSIQDAQAAMRLYTMEKKNWEAAIKAKYSQARTEPQKAKPPPPSS